jgi:hypothetical protein
MILLMIILILTANIFGQASYEIKDQFFISYQWGMAFDVAADGTVLAVVVGLDGDKAIEIRNGQIVRDYSRPNARIEGLGFSPRLERYIIFREADGAVIASYAADGRRLSERNCPQIVWAKRLVIDPEGHIVVLGIERKLTERRGLRTAGQREKPLFIYKYDQNGNELFPQHVLSKGEAFLPDYGEQSEKPIGRILLAAGTAGETALYRGDQKVLHWLDSDGNNVLKIPFERIPTAIQFVRGELLVASGKLKGVSSPRSGVYAMSLIEPHLTQFHRDGRRTDIVLPPEALGVKAIDRNGNLFKVNQDSLMVFSRRIPRGVSPSSSRK